MRHTYFNLVYINKRRFFRDSSVLKLEILHYQPFGFFSDDLSVFNISFMGLFNIYFN